MTKVFAQITMSLDGFAAGPDDSPEHPLGVGGLDLHRWIMSGTQTAVDKQVAAAFLGDAGAVVIGRRMADLGIPLWGPKGAFEKPTFIVTHRAAPVLVKGPTTFTYITEGVAQAVAAATKVAQGRAVLLGGGASIIRQALTAGLLDELRLDIAPIFLGKGRSLFHDLTIAGSLTPIQVLESPAATHITYRVDR